MQIKPFIKPKGQAATAYTWMESRRAKQFNLYRAQQSVLHEHQDDMDWTLETVARRDGVRGFQAAHPTHPSDWLYCDRSLNKMYKSKYITISTLLIMYFSLVVPFDVSASPQGNHGGYANPAVVNLLTVANFTALASTAVSSPAGGTNLNNGDLGITGIGCTDFPVPCTTPGATGVVNSGAIQNNNGVATTGQTDATAVVTDLNGRGANDIIAGGLLDGLTVGQGVYDVPGAATNLTGVLTLHGDANSIFIFRFASTFITGSTASVVVTGGARACNVFWTSVSETTFNDTTSMIGTVFAGTQVTFPGGGAIVNGRVIAQTADIVFNNTTINSNGICAPIVVVEDEEDNSVRALPNTGGAPIRNEYPWGLAFLGGFSALAVGLGVRRAYRRTHLPK